MSQTREHVMTVSDMTCEHCASTITEALEGVEGVINIDINLDQHEVKVVYDANKTQTADLNSAVTNKGYTVE